MKQPPGVRKKGAAHIVVHPMIRRAARAARMARIVMGSPPYAAPGHFYSPLTSRADVSRDRRWAPPAGVDLREAAQLELCARLRPWLEQPPPGPRYVPGNPMFGPADTAVYRAMLHYLQPGQIIEVGAGHSTAAALDESAAAGRPGLPITCIEPFPSVLAGLLRPGDRRRVTLLASPAQDVPLDTYRRLAAGDVLFIDSSHVVKAGSDVVWLLLHVLPALAPGVVVHVHDVFWPFEYPAAWRRERRDWTEDYLLHAFLIGNAGWEILFFPSWLWQAHPDQVPARIAADQPDSIWLRKTG